MIGVVTGDTRSLDCRSQGDEMERLVVRTKG